MHVCDSGNFGHFGTSENYAGFYGMVWVVRPKPCRTGVHHGAWFRSDDRNPQLDKVRTLKDWVHPGSSLGVVSVAQPKPPTSTFRTLNDWGPPYQDVQTPRRMGSTLGSGFGRSTETPHQYFQIPELLGSTPWWVGFGRSTQTHPSLRSVVWTTGISTWIRH